MTTTETQADHLDRAYESVRSLLHERPYRTDPGAVYADLGTLGVLLDALRRLAVEMIKAAEQATGADDDELEHHRAYVVEDLDRVASSLNLAKAWANNAHPHASHLIFGAEATERAS